MPLVYFEPGGEGVFNRINEACNRVESETGVSCSEHFRALVYNAITAITQDPSASWSASSNARVERSGELLAGLPKLLLEVANTASVGKRLSYFDGLHWLTSRLDSICPFDKARKPGRNRARE
jgi:hypothetical protein